jgi:hypothetical protein
MVEQAASVQISSTFQVSQLLLTASFLLLVTPTSTQYCSTTTCQPGSYHYPDHKCPSGTSYSCDCTCRCNSGGSSGGDGQSGGDSGGGEGQWYCYLCLCLCCNCRRDGVRSISQYHYGHQGAIISEPRYSKIENRIENHNSTTRQSYDCCFSTCHYPDQIPCSYCDAGKFSIESSAASCQPCPAGSYAMNKGITF